MRTFCTEGPIDKQENYYVPRTDLLNVGMDKIDQWRYFSIFAPRQSGKTTYFQFLSEKIKKDRAQILPVWISFERYGEISERTFLDFFQDSINDELKRKIPKETEISRLYYFLKSIIEGMNHELVLIIDEVEGLKNEKILNQFMHIIRDIYHKKKSFGLRSVILTGVSNITDQLNVPYFTREEVFDLLAQQDVESGQVFEENVKESIYDNTLGQPGLVCALARDLVEKNVAAEKR